MGVGESPSLLGQAGEVRCLDFRLGIVRLQIAVAHVVGHHENDVRVIVALGRLGCAWPSDCNCERERGKDREFHRLIRYRVRVYFRCELEGRASESDWFDRWFGLSLGLRTRRFVPPVSCLLFLWAVAGLGVTFFGELVAGPEDSTREEVEVDILLHGFVVVPSVVPNTRAFP